MRYYHHRIVKVWFCTGSLTQKRPVFLNTRPRPSCSLYIFNDSFDDDVVNCYRVTTVPFPQSLWSVCSAWKHCGSILESSAMLSTNRYTALWSRLRTILSLYFCYWSLFIYLLTPEYLWPVGSFKAEEHLRMFLRWCCSTFSRGCQMRVLVNTSHIIFSCLHGLYFFSLSLSWSCILHSPIVLKTVQAWTDNLSVLHPLTTATEDSGCDAPYFTLVVWKNLTPCFWNFLAAYMYRLFPVDMFMTLLGTWDTEYILIKPCPKYPAH